MRNTETFIFRNEAAFLPYAENALTLSAGNIMFV
jgi:hypothetical protein